MKLSIKVTLYIIVAAYIIVSPFIVINHYRITKILERSAVRRAYNAGYMISARLQSDLAMIMQEAETLAHSFSVLSEQQKPHRDQALDIIREVLRKNTRYFGIWTVWEPNAFDSLDSAYRFTYAHDPTGRLAAYFTRASGKIAAMPRKNYEKPLSGNYYLVPKHSKQSYITEPYAYTIGKREHRLVSFVVPILKNEKFVGAVGIDVNPAFFTEEIKDTPQQPYPAAALYSNQGKTVSIFNRYTEGIQFPESTQTHSEEFALFFEAIRKGKTYHFIDFSDDKKPRIQLLMPVQIGEKTAPYSLAMVMPTHTLADYVHRYRTDVLKFMTLGVLIFATLMFFVVRHIIKPLQYAIDFAEKVSEGNFDIQIKQQYASGGNEINRLMRSLQRLQVSLQSKAQKSKAENERRNWIQSGQNGLYEVMHGDQNLEKLANNIIAFLCKYTDSQLGAIYIFYEKTKYLKLTGTYCFSRTETSNYIKIGEGLVGQVASNNKTLTMNNVEHEYFASTSATIKLVPKNLTLVPFSLRQRVIGVLEMGRYEPYTQREEEFLDTVKENISIAFNTLIIRGRMIKHKRKS